MAVHGRAVLVLLPATSQNGLTFTSPLAQHATEGSPVSCTPVMGSETATEGGRLLSKKCNTRRIDLRSPYLATCYHSKYQPPERELL
jgi:hypothetical protein